jgi:hypothetical protein
MKIGNPTIKRKVNIANNCEEKCIFLIAQAAKQTIPVLASIYGQVGVVTFIIGFKPTYV